jgi:serine/threonine-protein kinase
VFFQENHGIMSDQEPWPGVFRSGEAVGEYRIMDVLGEGGMGVVYRANHPAFHRDVAIKVLPRARSASRAFRERFEKEAEALKLLNHRNIVSIIDKGSKEDNHYLVMELLPGRSLAERLAQGPIPVDEALDLILQIIDAVEYAHQRGIIHRDIKPGNVLLDDLGVPKVADFGIAQSMIRAEGENVTADEQVGTAEYAAPEQLTDAAGVDRRADVYAVAAVLYEMLTGLPPVGRLKPVHQLVKGVQPKVDAAIRKALSPNKEDRYESAALFGAALRRGQGLPDEKGPADSKEETTRTPVALIAAGGGSLVVVAVAVLIWAFSRGGSAATGAAAPAAAPTRPAAERPASPSSPPPRAAVSQPAKTKPEAETPKPPSPTPAPTPPPAPAPDALDAARKAMAAKQFQKAMDLLAAVPASNAEAKSLMDKARTAERAKLVTAANASVAKAQWDQAAAHVDAAAKLGDGPDLKDLGEKIAVGRRNALVEEAKKAMAANPDQALGLLAEARKLRDGPDLKPLTAQAEQLRKAAKEKAEAQEKYESYVREGDKAAERKDIKMARQWYGMALKINDAPDVRKKLQALKE